MAAAKWKQQAEGYLRQIIDLLRFFAEVDSISQESYKSRFFDIFSDAFRSSFCLVGYRYDEEKDRLVRCKAQRPLISGDRIWEYAKQQGWVHERMMDEKRYRDIERVRMWWDEWTYAWERHPPPRKYVRK